jgi:hypothetical protein
MSAAGAKQLQAWIELGKFEAGFLKHFKITEEVAAKPEPLAAETSDLSHEGGEAAPPTLVPSTLLQGKKREVKAQLKGHKCGKGVPSGGCSESKSYAHGLDDWQVTIQKSLLGA